MGSANPDRFVMDTTFVLFFLAMDIGVTAGTFGFELILSILTLSMFAAAPYLLPFAGEKPEFRGWLIGRIFIATVAVLAGFAIQNAAGIVLPGNVRYVPMTLLIVAGIFCAYTQIYATMKVRLAR